MAAWYDTGDPATADGFTNQQDSTIGFYDNIGLVLPAGEMSKLRFHVVQDLFGNGNKIAIYNNAGTLLANATATVAGAGWKEFNITPVTIGAGTYYLAAQTLNGGTDLQYSTKSGFSNGSTYQNVGGSTYAAFPPSTRLGSTTDLAVLSFFGVFLEPSAPPPANPRPFLTRLGAMRIR